MAGLCQTTHDRSGYLAETSATHSGGKFLQTGVGVVRIVFQIAASHTSRLATVAIRFSTDATTGKTPIRLFVAEDHLD